MIPITQTIFSDEEKEIHGNCFSSCIASILNIDLLSVPPFQDMGADWFQALFYFLAQNNLEFYGTGRKEDVYSYNIGVDGYYIVNGSSPRGFKRGHSIIFKDGIMVHDPHPSRLGVSDIWSYFMIERNK